MLGTVQARELWGQMTAALQLRREVLVRVCSAARHRGSACNVLQEIELYAAPRPPTTIELAFTVSSSDILHSHSTCAAMSSPQCSDTLSSHATMCTAVARHRNYHLAGASVNPQ
eukprot:8894-Heterococcus_DN1.PRE.8